MQTSTSRPTISIVIPYFGRWPSYFAACLKTCAANRSIDWHFFSDAPPVQGAGPNIHFHRLTPGEFCALAERQLGQPVALSTPYKICDMKPMYGAIFQDFIAGATFWGHADIDILFGDLRSFLTDDMLSKFDVVTPYTYAVGHLQLFRNVPEINALFRSGKDYVGATTGGYINFDELGMNPVLRSLGERWFRIAEPIALELARPKPRLGANLLRYGQLLDAPQVGTEIFYWESGRTFQSLRGDTREFAYIHFMQTKYGSRWKRRARKGPMSVADKMYVTLSGIRSAAEFERSRSWAYSPLRAPYLKTLSYLYGAYKKVRTAFDPTGWHLPVDRSLGQ